MGKEHTVDAVILAAGMSTRMGRPKLIMPLDGKAVVHYVIQASLMSDINEVIVVTGTRSGPIETSLGMELDKRIRFVTNHRPEDGMSSSMRVGLQALTQECDGVLFLLGDQPWIDVSTINRLISVFENDPHRIVVPAVHNRRTTPALFPKRLFAELSRVEGDVGGREVLQANLASVLFVEMGQSYNDQDIDTPDDFTRAYKTVHHFD
jgi:molybdenum cofactor cytidylyltransferase